MTELGANQSRSAFASDVSLWVDRAQRGPAVSACTSCGQDNAPDAQFCTECGEYLGWSSGAPAAAPPPTPAWVDDAAPADPPRRRRAGARPCAAPAPAPPTPPAPAPAPLPERPVAHHRGPRPSRTATGPPLPTAAAARTAAGPAEPRAARPAPTEPSTDLARVARALDGGTRSPSSRTAPTWQPPRRRPAKRLGRAGARRRRRRGVQARQEHAGQRAAADRRLPGRRRHRHRRPDARPLRRDAVGRRPWSRRTRAGTPRRRQEPVDVDRSPTLVSEAADTGPRRRLRSVEVRLPHRLLRTGPVPASTPRASAGSTRPTGSSPSARSTLAHGRAVRHRRLAGAHGAGGRVPAARRSSAARRRSAS